MLAATTIYNETTLDLLANFTSPSIGLRNEAGGGWIQGESKVEPISLTPETARYIIRIAISMRLLIPWVTML